MTKRIFLLLLLIVPVLVFSQRRNRYKYEISYGVGGSNYLGDLGGANRIGTHLLKDLEAKATRPSMYVAFRYKRSPYYALKTAFTMGWIYGGDQLTDQFDRSYRNLTFRSPIIEWSAQFEGYFTKEKPAHLYRIRNAHGPRKSDIQAYGFVGVALFFFNPQGMYKGAWYNLQHLGTEGQNLDPAKKRYSRFAFAIPIGLGMKYKITRRISFGIELGMRKTFTDYLDDVSKQYYDNSAILAKSGSIAAYLADPAHGGAHPEKTAAGEQRGNPSDKDTYMFAMFNGNYKFYKKKRTRTKF